MDKDEAWKSAFAGAMGGIALVAVGYPFDLIKTRIQVGDRRALAEVKRIVKLDGLWGLYRGATPVFLGVIPVYALMFFGYDLGKRLSTIVYPKDEAKDGDYTLRQIAFAGGFSAIPTTAFLGPAERIKVLLQTQEGRNTTSIVGLIQDTFKRGGMRGMFRGTLATLGRDTLGSVGFFWVYEKIKRSMTAWPKTGIVMAGGFAGIAHWALIMPLDVVKTKYQSSSVNSTMLETARAVVKKDGLVGMYKGLQPALARAFPANAASFATVELVKSLL
jgi:solute carrier family 25 carnitine/acylcarnitine transporter 20/29